MEISGYQIREALSKYETRAKLAESQFPHTIFAFEGEEEKITPTDVIEEYRKCQDAICKLPKNDAAQFRDTMKEAREDNKPLEERISKLHGDLHAILTADSFDKGAFLAKRKEVQQLHDQMETNMTEAFASAVDGLTQEERVTLTRALHHDHDKHRPMNKKTSNKYPAQPKTPIADVK